MPMPNANAPQPEQSGEGWFNNVLQEDMPDSVEGQFLATAKMTPGIDNVDPAEAVRERARERMQSKR